MLPLDSRSMCQRKTGEEQVSPSEFSPDPNLLQVTNLLLPRIFKGMTF